MHTNVSRALAVSAALVVWGSPALAQSPAAGPAQAKAAAPAFANAVRAVRDPATGKLRKATQAELAAMVAAEQAERAARGLPDNTVDVPVQVRQHAGGMVSAELSVEHLVNVQARRGADGRLVRTHAHPSMEHPVAPAGKQRPTE